MMTTTKRIGLCRTERVYTLGKTRPATDPETRLGIQSKLLEECGEVIRAPRDADEYADVMQVLFDMARLNGVSRGAIHCAFVRKADECGGFLRADGTALVWEPDDDQ